MFRSRLKISKTEWRWWFAWFPLRAEYNRLTGNYTLVFWEYVLRKYDPISGNWVYVSAETLNRSRSPYKPLTWLERRDRALKSAESYERTLEEIQNNWAFQALSAERRLRKK